MVKRIVKDFAAFHGINEELLHVLPRLNHENPFGIRYVEMPSEFYVITEATPDSTLADIMFKTDYFGLARQLKGGLDPSEIVAICALSAENKAVEIATETLASAGANTPS